MRRSIFKVCLVIFLVSLPVFSFAATHAKYVEGEVLVKYKQSSLSSLQSNHSLSPVSSEARIGVIKSATKSTEELISELSSSPDIEAVQPNYIYYIASQEVPWGTSTNGVMADTANNLDYTGSGVVVAVIDTGVLYTHEDLSNNIWNNSGEIADNGLDDDGNGYIDDIYGYDFVNDDSDPIDDNGHGTHVSGTIAAEDNDVGVVGVAPEAQIMALKVLSSDGYGSDTAFIEALNYASANGADVVNMSLRGYSYDQFLEEAINNTIAAGVVVVAAAGNEAENSLAYPAAFAGVITVGAVQETVSDLNPTEDMNTRLADFSNYGKVDVVAPGVGINSTTYDGDYSGATWNGTSMATPHVVGVVALLKQAYSDLTPARAKQILMASAQDLGEEGIDQYFGAGLVDAPAALALANSSINLQANFTEDNSTNIPTLYLPAILADGESTTKIKATVINADGEALSGRSVTFSTTAGTLVGDNSVLTDSSGVAEIEIMASNDEEEATVAAAVSGITSKTVNIQFTKNLLVSDASEVNNYTTFSWYYRQAFIDNDINFVRWDTASSYPSAEYLSKFSTVYWYTADQSLTDDAQNILVSYLEDNGNLFLSGQDILYYINQGSATDILPTTYLGVTYSGDSASGDVVGEDIFSDLTFSLSNPGYSGGGLYPDYISTSGISSGYYSSDTGYKTGTIIDSTYNSIFLSYGFEAITDKVSRDSVLLAVNNFFSGLIAVPNLTVGNIEKTSAELSWEAIGGALSYLVSCGTDALATNLVNDSTSETSYSLSDLSKNTKYYCKVAVTTSSGTSEYSNIESFSTLPAKPTHIKLKSRTDNEVKIKWNAVSGSDIKYEVSYGKTIKANSKKTTTTKTSRKLKSLTSNQKYYYKIRAKGSDSNSDWSKIYSFRTLPKKPKNITFSVNLNGSLNISWKKSRGKIEKYVAKLYYNSGAYIGTYKTVNTNYSFYNLLPAKYKVKIKAERNSDNVSESAVKKFSLPL